MSCRYQRHDLCGLCRRVERAWRRAGRCARQVNLALERADVVLDAARTR
jgi:hypothetical protein